MYQRPLKDWTLDDVIAHATWEAVASLTKGASLKSAVRYAILLGFNWKAAQGKEKQQQ